MKVRKALLLTLALLLCAACAPAEPEWEGLSLYFLPADAAQGPALRAEPYQGQETPPDPGHLLEALVAGPTDESLLSPFPQGLSLRSWSWSTEQSGVIQVNFSEHYGGLTDISLTLADYCVALTLCQMEGVTGVEITSGGQSMRYRSHQVLQAEEVVLPENEGEVAP